MQDDWYILVSSAPAGDSGRPPLMIRDAVGPPIGHEDALDGTIRVYRSSVGWLACQGTTDEVKPLMAGAFSEIGGWRLKLANLENDVEASLVDRTGFLAPELHVRDPNHLGEPLRRIRLPSGDSASLVIGRGQDADVQLADHKVSRRHLQLRVQDGRWHAEDLGSLWKSFIRGAEFSGPALLSHGDEIRLGDTVLVFVNHMEALEAHHANGANGDPRGDRSVSKHGRAALIKDRPAMPLSLRGPAAELLLTALIVLLVTGVLVYAVAAICGELFATGVSG